MVSEFPSSLLVLRLRPLACRLSHLHSVIRLDTKLAEAMPRANGHGNERTLSISRTSAESNRVDGRKTPCSKFTQFLCTGRSYLLDS